MVLENVNREITEIISKGVNLNTNQYSNNMMSYF